MILPVLVFFAVAWVLTAPDPVTAGARTAAGTGAKAAGTGVRAHWAAGRGQRQARRTQRRDRWWKAGGARRAALRAEHAAVWSWGAGKTVAGVTAAAAKPVPAAAKAGWSRGQERHRNRAGNRPVPIAVDPPWWRREHPAQGEQPAPEQGAEQPQVQVPVQGGNSPAAEREQGVGTGEDADAWMVQNPVRSWRETPHERVDDAVDPWQDPTPTGETVCEAIGRYDGSTPVPSRRGRPRPPERETCRWWSHDRGRCPRDPDPGSEDGLCDRHHYQRYGVTPTAPSAPPSGVPSSRICGWCDERPGETVRGKLAVCGQCAAEIDGRIARAKRDHPPVEADPQMPPAPDVEEHLDTEEEIRARWGPAWNRMFDEPLTEADRRFWTARDRGYTGPLDQDGRPGDPEAWPFKTVPAPADGTTVGAPATTGTTPPTEGAPVFNQSANVPTVELNDLDSVKRFSEYVATLPEDSEFMQIVKQCKVIRENFRGGGFGGDMDTAGAAFEESASAVATVVAEFCEQSTQYAGLAANVAGG